MHRSASNLFHSALLRLTILYLLIIAIISVTFSIGLYRVSSAELARSINRPISRELRDILSSQESLYQLRVERQTQYSEAIDRLRSNLFFLNLLIIIGGGGLSYLLAKRTLLPIEKAHEAQSRFTSDASHELRTPITAMRVETELTLTDPKLTIPMARKQLESNIEELDKLTALSENLLELARLNGGELLKEQIDLKEVAKAALSRLKIKANKKKQNVVLNGISIAVPANFETLTEAVVVLLDNAIKYSPEKSEINLIISAVSRHTAELSVSDEGPGVPKNEQRNIFDRFYRLDSSRAHAANTGFGIGLSLAKTIVDEHGGSIIVKNNHKAGATFTLRLPR